MLLTFHTDKKFGTKFKTMLERATKVAELEKSNYVKQCFSKQIYKFQPRVIRNFRSMTPNFFSMETANFSITIRSSTLDDDKDNLIIALRNV